MFSGIQPRQDVEILPRFKDSLHPHLQGVADGLVQSKLSFKLVYE
jgi:hypothetical protein